MRRLAFAEVTTAIACLFEHGHSEALREVLAAVRDGADARVAVARAYGGSGAWGEFERAWRQFMADLHYKTLPGMEAIVPKYRKKNASPVRTRSARTTGLVEHRRGRPLLAPGQYDACYATVLARASVEYEKGLQDCWEFALDLLGETRAHLFGPGRGRPGPESR
jgi:hypothetical protein